MLARQYDVAGRTGSVPLEQLDKLSTCLGKRPCGRVQQFGAIGGDAGGSAGCDETVEPDDKWGRHVVPDSAASGRVEGLRRLEGDGLHLANVHWVPSPPGQRTLNEEMR